MRYDAVIFDLDGTLIDTESQAFEAGKRAFDEMGLTLTEALFHQLVGRDVDSGYTLIRQWFGDVDRDRLEARWVAHAQTLQSQGIPIKPGARELIAHLEQLNWPKAICTSSQRDSARRKMGHSGLTAHFDLVITADDVEHRKPSPTPYLLTAARLDVRPDRVLVFEDSETGAEAAYRAGMTVVQVPDLVAASGQFAHHVAQDLMAGAQWAGIL
ncbi:MAG: HAD family phosphatase [Pelagimonas sp.]|jgi:HAD superfamily hydrolase (TIGR01509 family)|nr:HAD family phosphatase [Pelagimonas sp.]